MLFDAICNFLWSFLFFLKEDFRASAPNRVHSFTPLLWLHMKLFTWRKACLQIRLSLKSLVLIRVGTKAFSNFHKPFSFWAPCAQASGIPAPNPMRCVASTMCASITNVNITPTHPNPMSCVAWTMCASIMNVNITPTYPNPMSCVASTMCASAWPTRWKPW